MAKVEVYVNADGSQAVRELGRVEHGIKQTGNAAKSASKQLNDMASSMKALAASDIGTKLAGLASSIVQAGASCIMAAAQMRQYEIAFQTMLKSAEKGTQMLKDLQKFAAETPFDVPGVVQAGQQLMAFGFKAQEVIPMLTSLGDAAAGLGKGTAGVQQLAYALGQMQTSGKLNAQDMMQLTNAGVAAWDMLAKAAGKSVMEIKDLTSKGAIDSKEAVKVIVDGINQQFGGMMAKTSQEVTGLLANIEETAGTTAAVVGKYMIDAFNVKGILKGVSEELGSFQQYMQECSDKGVSFSSMLKGLGDGGQALVVVMGALAAVIGVVLVGAIGAAIAALVTVAGLSAPVIVAAGAIGGVLASLAIEWDNITSKIRGAIEAAKEFFGIESNGGYGGSFAEEEKPKAPKGPTTNPNLIKGGDTKVKGAHHKTEEEREIDALMKKYNKVGNTFKDLKYQAEQTKVIASTLFGDQKNVVAHQAALDDIQATHDKINSELNAELELAAKITNAEDREYVIGEINKQMAAEKELYETKKKAEEIKFNTRNIDTAQMTSTYLDKAFGTYDEMEKKKEDVSRFIKEINDMAVNAQNGYGTMSGVGDLSQDQQSYISKILKQTPEQLTAEYDDKKGKFSSFVDFLSTKMAEATAAESKNKTIGEQWKEAQVGWISQIGSSMGNAVGEWLNGTKTIGQAMKDMVKNLLAQAAQLLAQWLMVFGILSIWNPTKVTAAEAANKIVLGIGGKALASGGFVSGEGTATSDSIPAMLSNGEYVINAAAVSALGVPFLNGLNTGKYRYASGGLVGSSGEGVANTAVTSNSSIVLNISAIDATGFGEFLERGGLNDIKQAMLNDSRKFAEQAGIW